MKILTNEQIRQADKSTFAKGVPSLSVMETAGRAIVDLLLNRYPSSLKKTTLVVVGKGNNGGDGFVVARTLLLLGFKVEVWGFTQSDSLTGDASIMAKAFIGCGGSYHVFSESAFEEFRTAEWSHRYGLIVDALFGTGFKGTTDDFVEKVIELVNRYQSEFFIPVVSVDLPSGLPANEAYFSNQCVQASATVCLQNLKPAHVLMPSSNYCGEVYLADIGVDISDCLREGVFGELISLRRIKSSLEKLSFSSSAHKGNRGRLAIIGGSSGHLGAAKMAGLSALKTGAGLVTVYLPVSFLIEESALAFELMFGSFSGVDGVFSQNISEQEVNTALEDKTALVIGCGIGQREGVKSLLLNVLSLAKKNTIPIVIDADALNVIASNQELLGKLGPHAVLTPHPAEMARLTGLTTSDIESNRVGHAKSFSIRNHCWLVLKGARTVVSGPAGEVFINPTATATLATAGSGDVLSGTIGAFLGMGLTPRHAAQVAVFVHGVAGELLNSKKGGNLGATALEIAELIPVIANHLVNTVNETFSTCNKVLPGALTAEQLSELKSKIYFSATRQ
jgi:NAD(P)H-hydrate epimerase